MKSIVKLLEVGKPFQATKKDKSPVRKADGTLMFVLFLTVLEGAHQFKLRVSLDYWTALCASNPLLAILPQQYSLSCEIKERRFEGKSYTYTDENGVSHETEPQTFDQIIARDINVVATGSELINATVTAFMNRAAAQTFATPAPKKEVVKEGQDIIIDDVE